MYIVTEEDRQKYGPAVLSLTDSEEKKMLEKVRATFSDPDAVKIVHPVADKEYKRLEEIFSLCEGAMVDLCSEEGDDEGFDILETVIAKKYSQLVTFTQGANYRSEVYSLKKTVGIQNVYARLFTALYHISQGIFSPEVLWTKNGLPEKGYPGKFEGNHNQLYARYLHRLSLEGSFDDEAGDVGLTAHYGLLVTNSKEDLMWAMDPAHIIETDSNGFVDVVSFSSVEEAERRMEAIKEELDYACWQGWYEGDRAVIYRSPEERTEPQRTKVFIAELCECGLVNLEVSGTGENILSVPVDELRLEEW